MLAVRALAQQIADHLLQSRLGRFAADVAVRRFGGGPFMGPVMRIMVDAWGISCTDVQWVFDNLDGATTEAWATAWGRRGHHYAIRAEGFHSRGMVTVARSLYARASLCYQAGSYSLSNVSPLREHLYSRSVALHDAHGRLCVPPIRRLVVPYEGGQLYAYLQLPATRGTEEPPWPVVVVVPGLGSTKEQPDFRTDLLLERRIAVCAFDLPGHGQSRDSLSLEIDSYRAVSAIIDALAGEPDVTLDHLALLGTSLGAAVVLRAGVADSRVQNIAAIAGFYEPRHWYARSARFVDAALRFAAQDPDGAKTQQLVDEITLRGSLHGMKADVLLIHGDHDVIIPVEECHQIAAELGDRADVWVVPGGDHAATNVAEVRLIIADWLARHACAVGSTACGHAVQAAPDADTGSTAFEAARSPDAARRRFLPIRAAGRTGTELAPRGN